MDWKDVGMAVARNNAPLLGMAIGGPAGGAIAAGIAAAFSVESTPEAVARAIEADPGAALKLQELQARHAEILATLAAQQYDAQIQDVQDARAKHRDHWMPAALTIALAAMVMGIVAALMTVDTPASNAEVIYLIAGQLIGAFATAVAYWLGFSRGSVEKQRSSEGAR